MLSEMVGISSNAQSPRPTQSVFVFAMVSCILQSAMCCWFAQNILCTIMRRRVVHFRQQYLSSLALPCGAALADWWLGCPYWNTPKGSCDFSIYSGLCWSWWVFVLGRIFTRLCVQYCVENDVTIQSYYHSPEAEMPGAISGLLGVDNMWMDIRVIR